MFSEQSCILNYHLIPKILGRGSFGVVYEAIEPITLKKAAIKRMPFSYIETDFLSLYREISILRVLKGHPNIVSLEHVEILDDEIYLVFECYATDLSKIIRSRQPLTIEHIRYFLYQILYGIEYLHSAKLVHRDLKPSNILVNIDCHIKICDFGLARAIVDADETMSAQESRNLSNYVVTRWYRSPEVILLFPRGGEAPTDIWSIGCIFAELFFGRPAFPGRTQKEVLYLVFKLMGAPKQENNAWLDECQHKIVFQSIEQLPGEFNQVFAGVSSEISALLSELLEFNPHRRISAEQALKHTFFKKFDAKKDDENTLSLASCSGLEQESFKSYIQLERQLNNKRLDRQSPSLTQHIQSLIQTEVRHYQNAKSTTSLEEQVVIPADNSTSTILPASTSASSPVAGQSFFSSSNSNTDQQVSCSQNSQKTGPH